MIRIVLLLTVLIAGIYAVKKILHSTNVATTAGKFKIFSIIMGALVLFLAVTGHLNLLLALFGLVMAVLARWMPVLLRYAPQIGRLLYFFRAQKQQTHWQRNEGSKRNNHFKQNSRMSLDEAYEILDLKKGASKDEIIIAHRKLMQKMHPDRGGNNYFAAKINMAKQILLEN